MNTNYIDQKARDMAQSALAAVTTHERVCAERWHSAMTTMAEIKRILGWATATILATLLGLIGFLATHPLH